MPQSVSKLLDQFAGPLAVLTALIGLVVWLTTLHNIAENNAAQIANLRQEFNLFENKISSVDDRLARLETKIDLLVDRR